MRKGSSVSTVVSAGISGAQQRDEAMPLVEIIEPDLFVVNVSRFQEIPCVVQFVYQVGERVAQAPYVAAFSVDGRRLGGLPLEGPREKAVVRRGRGDVVDLDQLDGGREIVVWRPPSEGWTCELVGRHWDHHAHVCWGLFVDSRALDEVERNLQATWPRRHAHGDHSGLLESTVGPDRKLVMLSYDSYSFFGKTTAECWKTVKCLLAEVSEGDLDVYNSADDG